MSLGSFSRANRPGGGAALLNEPRDTELVLASLRVHPHGNASVCKLTCFASFCPIVHMDPVNSLFWNLVSKKNLKTLPLRPRVDSESAYVAYRWRHRPSTSNLRPLNPATSHNNNNNNNNGLHACDRAAEDIEPIRVTRTKYSAALSLRWAKKDYGQPTSHFLLPLAVFFFYCLFVYSTQALCTCSATYRPGIWTTACWVVYNGSVWTQIFLKRWRGSSFWYVWTWPKLNWLLAEFSFIFSI